MIQVYGVLERAQRRTSQDGMDVDKDLKEEDRWQTGGKLFQVKEQHEKQSERRDISFGEK